MDKTMPKPVWTPVGKDGNAFALMGTWAVEARLAGWTQEQAAAVRTEAMSGDYHHLLTTLMANSAEPELEEADGLDDDE